ncbi:cubilin-like isoform X2 [Rhopilema esculentum]|uniref:cubilin-like isoform X2 n=1 Tax=Rhopilema esculentum TaxID=499914 RepID=UPI0031E19C50
MDKGGGRGNTLQPSKSPFGCHHSFLSHSGNFTSPGYPKYPVNQTCRYRLTVPINKGIRVNFIVFSLPQSVACKYYGSVKIYEDGTLKAKLCGNGSRIFQSYGNSVVIDLQIGSDNVKGYSGFQATFTATEKVCNYTLSLGSPYFSSPGYSRFSSPTNNYPSNINCYFHIDTPLSHVVRLNWQQMDIEYGKYCGYDSIKVYDNKTLGKTLCGNYAENWISKSSRVLVVFKTDGSVTGRGFIARYSQVHRSCFQTFTSATGSFTSPSNNKYPDGLNCIYRINVPKNKSVKINFEVLGLPNNCREASVVLYENNPRPSYKTEKAVFCGWGPRTFQSLSNDVYIKFRPSNGNFRNFYATYEAIEKVCNYTISIDSPRFSSPKFPDNYPNSVYCQYHIKVDYNSVVRIDFEKFYLQYSPSCENDAVMIFENGVLRDKFCGYYSSKSWYSTSHSVTVVLKSDGSTTRSGFIASYRPERKYIDYLLESVSGSFTSPGFPANYSSNEGTSYQIIVPNGMGIRVDFTTFSLQPSNSCQYQHDQVDIYEIFGGAFNLKERNCGQGARSFLSYSNKVHVYFKSSPKSGNRFQGFYATFNATEPVCNYSLTETSTMFTSPGYPDQYPSNVSCRYHIRVPDGKIVRIHFETFLLQAGIFCAEDSVKIYENNALQETLCGYQPKTVWESKESQVLLVFKSDGSITSRGFSGYITLADKPVHLPFVANSGNFSSPGYPGNYPKNARWIYHVTVPVDHGIQIEFPVFSLRPSLYCQNDSVKIYEGGRFASSDKASFCGNGPKQFHSYSNSIYVDFRSSSEHNNVYKGFHAIFGAISKACNYTLAGASRTFASPGYPNNFPNYVYCSYHIKVPINKAVKINFSSFLLHQKSTCKNNSIAIFEDNILKKTLDLCRSPVSWESRDNQALVVFRSSTGAAFHASYSAVEKPCWYKITSSFGKFTSPGYPGIHSSIKKCIYEITVQPENGIIINFPIFSIHETMTCYDDSVEIFEENMEVYNLKATFCGLWPRTYRSYSNRVFVVLKTSSKYGTQSKGFSANFAESKKACNYTISNGLSYFTSPGYPSSYPNDVKCHYHILAPYDRAVSLNFKKFSLQPGRSCTNDSLTVSEKGFFVKSFCGEKGAFTWTSRGSLVTMIFKSDSSSTSSGFYGYYSTAHKACYKSYESKTGSFTSPGFPEHYPSSATCEYLITVEERKMVMIVFSEFDLQYVSECRNDSVQIFDATESGYTPAAKFCGTGKREFRSKGNRVLVRFTSDLTISRSGFAATYYSLENN